MKSSKNTINEIVGKIRTSKELCIVLHKNPDGDTLGSSLALYSALKELGKTARLYCMDPTPAAYFFLPDVKDVSDEFKTVPLLITVDCADPSMTGAAMTAIAHDGVETIVIDHHRSNKGYGSINWIDDKAAATAELMYQLLIALGTNFTPEIADCLYTAIVTDTGRFSFDYTRSESLRIAAALIDAGADFSYLCNQIFRQRSLGKTRLLGAAIGTLTIDEERRIAFMHVTQDMISRCNATHEDTETIINYGIEIEGILVALLLHQMKADEYKISFRAADSARVDKAAQSLGGGGHIKASGCTLKGSYDQVLEQALHAVRQYAFI